MPEYSYLCSLIHILMGNVYLIGYMASGKTTLGHAAAKRWGWEMVDTDQAIEQETGMSVAQIFATRGQDAFRALESDMLRRVSRHQRLVVATGGGLPTIAGNMELMLTTGTVIWLKASTMRTVCRLLLQQGQRPLAAGKSQEELMEMVARMEREREPFYSRAHVKFCSDFLETPRQIQETVDLLSQNEILCSVGGPCARNL